MRVKFSFYRFLSLLIFGSLGLGQFQRIQITPSIAIYIHDILIGLLVTFTLPKLIDYRKILWKNKLFMLYLVFIASLCVSFLINIPSILSTHAPALHLFRFILYSSLLLTFFVLRKSKVISKSLQVGLIATGFLILASGIIQYLFFPDMRAYQLLGWDNHYYRSISALLDPNFFGLILVLLWILARQFFTRHSTKIQTLILVALFFTYSRSAYLSFIAAAFIIAIQRKSKKVILGAIASLIVAFILLPRPGGEGVKLLRTTSIYTRLKSQQQSLSIFYQKPIFGIGFNAYSLYSPTQNDYDFVPSHPSSPDNSFLLILATSGVVGLSVFLWFSKSFTQKYKTHPVLLPSYFSILTHSLFNNSFFYPWVIIWLIVLWSEEMVTESSGQK